MSKYYINYHKHTDFSNIFGCDVCVKPDNYVNRLIELGDTHKVYFTTEHGTGGDIFYAKSLCDKENIHCKYGIEGYIVPQYHTKEGTEDKSNYHIIIIPKNNEARKDLNEITSQASIKGFYYRPRLTVDDLLSLNPDNYFLTTACVGGILRDDIGVTDVFVPLVHHFKRNMFIEVQPHLDVLQLQHNQKCLELSLEYNIPLISACDSHYIYEKEIDDRKNFILGKRNKQEIDWSEGSFLLDYPSYDEVTKRYKLQGVLSNKQAEQALEQTLCFLDCEDIELDKEVKMPYNPVNKENSISEKNTLLKNKILNNFEHICVEDNLTKDEKEQRLDGLKQEFQTIQDTSELNTSDYFLLNNDIVKEAVKRGGILTRTGRGSCGSYYINRVLGITQIDRFSTTIPMYPDRFMSTARLLENRAMPDIDFNVAEQIPFVDAARHILGEKGCFPMITYGTMKTSAAFRNVCRSKGVEFEEINKIAKSISDDNNVTTIPEKYKDLFEESKKYIGIIDSSSVHACAHVLSNQDITREIGVVRIGDSICAMITSEEADEYKWLKDDFLVVTCWKIISEVFKKINHPIMNLKQLLEKVREDSRIWDLYANGITSTLNQVDSEYATNLCRKYKPKTVEELTFFVAALRPSFDSYRERFLNREDFQTGITEYDRVMQPSGGVPIFQESLMRFFEWLNVPPNESISIIKKISKKKIKPDDFTALENKLKEQWVQKTGEIGGFAPIWRDIQSMMAYGFAAPHAYATAIDSLYGAYLKVNYPLEYYSICLNIYKNDINTTARLSDELNYFGIKLIPPQVGTSTGEYSIVEESNAIAKGVGAVKYINSEIADKIYCAVKENKPKTFFDMLSLLKSIGVSKKQIEPLIAINYFSPYGNIATLRMLYQIMQWLKFGEAKRVDILKLECRNEDIINILQTYSVNKDNSNIYTLNNMESLLKQLEEYVKNLNLEDIPIREKINNQIEYIGSIDICTKNPDDIRKLIILNNPIPLKGSNGIWGRRVRVRSIGTGNETSLTIKEFKYKMFPLKERDIIYATKVTKNNKGYWFLNSYQILEN